jgi:hypothetical protein
MTDRTLAEAWEDFSSTVLVEAGVPSDVRPLLKVIFYSGALAELHLVVTTKATLAELRGEIEAEQATVLRVVRLQ